MSSGEGAAADGFTVRALLLFLFSKTFLQVYRTDDLLYSSQRISYSVFLKKKKKANGDNFVVVTIISLMSKAEYSPYFWDCGREKL